MIQIGHMSPLHLLLPVASLAAVLAQIPNELDMFKLRHHECDRAQEPVSDSVSRLPDIVGVSDEIKSQMIHHCGDVVHASLREAARCSPSDLAIYVRCSDRLLNDLLRPIILDTHLVGDGIVRNILALFPAHQLPFVIADFVQTRRDTQLPVTWDVLKPIIIEYLKECRLVVEQGDPGPGSQSVAYLDALIKSLEHIASVDEPVRVASAFCEAVAESGGCKDRDALLQGGDQSLLYLLVDSLLTTTPSDQLLGSILPHLNHLVEATANAGCTGLATRVESRHASPDDSLGDSARGEPSLIAVFQLVHHRFLTELDVANRVHLSAPFCNFIALLFELTFVSFSHPSHQGSSLVWNWSRPGDHRFSWSNPVSFCFDLYRDSHYPSESRQQRRLFCLALISGLLQTRPDILNQSLCCHSEDPDRDDVILQVLHHFFDRVLVEFVPNSSVARAPAKLLLKAKAILAVWSTDERYDSQTRWLQDVLLHCPSVQSIVGGIEDVLWAVADFDPDTWLTPRHVCSLLTFFNDPKPLIMALLSYRGIDFVMAFFCGCQTDERASILEPLMIVLLSFSDQLLSPSSTAIREFSWDTLLFIPWADLVVNPDFLSHLPESSSFVRRIHSSWWYDEHDASGLSLCLLILKLLSVREHGLFDVEDVLAFRRTTSLSGSFVSIALELYAFAASLPLTSRVFYPKLVTLISTLIHHSDTFHKFDMAWRFGEVFQAWVIPGVDYSRAATWTIRRIIQRMKSRRPRLQSDAFLFFVLRLPLDLSRRSHRTAVKSAILQCCCHSLFVRDGGDSAFTLLWNHVLKSKANLLEWFFVEISNALATTERRMFKAVATWMKSSVPDESASLPIMAELIRGAQSSLARNERVRGWTLLNFILRLPLNLSDESHRALIDKEIGVLGDGGDGGAAVNRLQKLRLKSSPLLQHWFDSTIASVRGRDKPLC